MPDSVAWEANGGKSRAERASGDRGTLAVILPRSESRLALARGRRSVDDRRMTQAQTILVPLAPGFEEIEFVTIVDVLRRADLDVTVAGLVRGVVTGAHDVAITPDAYLGDIDLDRFTMIVLPGGQPGTRNLAKDERVLGVVRRLAKSGSITAAICAAPKVLHAAGILEGVEVTAHSSVRGDLTGAIVKTEPRTVTCGPVVTSQGAGTAMEFALTLVAILRGDAKANELGRAMVVPRG